MEEFDNIKIIKDGKLKNQEFPVAFEDGTEKMAEVLLVFSLGEKEEESEKVDEEELTSDDETKYIIYTFNEKDDDGFVILYASLLQEENGSIILDDIENEDIWLKVKDVMRNVIREGREEA